MLDKLARLEEEYRELEALLADPEVLKDQKRYQALSRRYAEMGEIIALIREYRKVREDLEQAESLLEDPELREVAKAEKEELLVRKEALERELERHLLPKDPMDERDAIVEIRAGTGGEEAALFARDLLEMYLRFAEEMGLGNRDPGLQPHGPGGLFQGGL
jgi:peptide chain release factor 1